jgi:maltose O-acetyltransferase
MSEETEMLSGRIFDPNEASLAALKRVAHDLCAEFNRALPSETEKRDGILRKLLGALGPNGCIRGPVFFNYGTHTRIGANFFGNFQLVVSDDAEVTIGDDVMFGPNVTLATPMHPMLAEERRSIDHDGRTFQPCFAKPIRIGDDVWLASGVTVTGGVTIGNGAVIGANSVVVDDVPPRVFAAGSPCRVIRPITEADSILRKPELYRNNDTAQ